jgi:5'-3' exonuclease
MLLDTASLYFRAFFGVPDMRSPDGHPVNAVRGLLDFVTRLTSTRSPSHLVACWDDDWRPAWRVSLIPSYKSHRVVRVVPGGVDIEETPDPLMVQVPLIREALALLRVTVVGAPGYEADDVIGTLATHSQIPVDVVTGDRDLFQLVDDERQVRVLYTARGVGNLEVLDEAAVVKKYGVLPEQYADFAAMRGDTSDGLPGVKGVGEKTAAVLLRQYGDLAGIRAAAADGASGLGIAVRGKIQAAGEYLDVAPKVVEVERDIPLPQADYRIHPLTPDQLTELEEFAARWGLGSSARKAADALRAQGSWVNSGASPSPTSGA